MDSLCILWISSAGLWVATIWTETFTCVSSFLACICFVLGLHGGFQKCHLVHGPFYCEHDGVVLLVDCWRSVCGIFGHGSRLQRHHQCISTICSVLLFPVVQVLLHSSAMNRLAHSEAIPVSMAVPWTRR